MKFVLNIYEDKASACEISTGKHLFQEIIEECLKLHNQLIVELGVDGVTSVYAITL